LFASEAGTDTQIKLIHTSDGNKVSVLEAKHFEDKVTPQGNGRALFNDAKSKAVALRHAANGPARKQIAQGQAGQQANVAQMQAVKAAQVALVAALDALAVFIAAHGCQYLNSGCFAAGTKLWTPQGYKPVESFVAGDVIYSRDEHDPSGPIEAKVVEEVFERFAGVYNLHIGGQVIGTSGEHPFYVEGKGWTKAFELQPGDRVATADGVGVLVEEVWDTGEWELVYNLRVADHHTYFVGDEHWGWAAWAHNAYAITQRINFSDASKTVIASLPASPSKPSNHTQWVSNWWNTDGHMHADPVKEIKFAFGVANSLRRAGATESAIQGVFSVICGFPSSIVSKAIEDAFRPDSSRLACVGATPGKQSATGQTVLARMANEANPHDPTTKMAYQDGDGKWWIYSIRPQGAGATIPPTGYYPLSDCAMGHHPIDAVVWWNDGGKFLPRLPNGGPGEEVRAWMTNPDNYQLQLGSHNSSAGSQLKAKGYFWVPPGTPD
jgi:hypothetical protein